LIVATGVFSIPFSDRPLRFIEGPPSKTTEGLVKREMKLFCKGLETRS